MMVDSLTMYSFRFSGTSTCNSVYRRSKSILISRYFTRLGRALLSHTRDMRFLLLVIDDELAPASSEEMQAIGRFNDRLRADGQLVMAEGIHSGSNATVFDSRGGGETVTAGSHHTDSARYTGFWIIDVDDEARARSIAQGASLACNRRVELRALLA